jgi:hypothetical protein
MRAARAEAKLVLIMPSREHKSLGIKNYDIEKSNRGMVGILSVEIEGASRAGLNHTLLS